MTAGEKKAFAARIIAAFLLAWGAHCAGVGIGYRKGYEEGAFAAARRWPIRRDLYKSEAAYLKAVKQSEAESHRR